MPVRSAFVFSLRWRLMRFLYKSVVRCTRQYCMISWCLLCSSGSLPVPFYLSNNSSFCFTAYRYLKFFSRISHPSVDENFLGASFLPRRDASRMKPVRVRLLLGSAVTCDAPLSVPRLQRVKKLGSSGVVFERSAIRQSHSFVQRLKPNATRVSMLLL